MQQAMRDDFIVLEGVCSQTKAQTIWIKSGENERPIEASIEVASKILPGHSVRALLNKQHQAVRVFNQTTDRIYYLQTPVLTDKEITATILRPTIYCGVPILGLFLGCIIALNLAGQAIGMPHLRARSLKIIFTTVVAYLAVAGIAANTQAWTIFFIGPVVVAFFGFRTLYRAQNEYAEALTELVRG